MDDKELFKSIVAMNVADMKDKGMAEEEVMELIKESISRIYRKKGNCETFKKGKGSGQRNNCSNE